VKQYDSINYYGDNWGIPIIAFDKLDGSNIRAEWSPKRGFYKFGTRKMMIDEKHEQFGFVIKLFLDKYQKPLGEIFKSKEYRHSLSFVCFAELVGSRSEFGQHDLTDTFDVILFDISQYKRGFIPPREFIKNFGHVGIPRVIYDGNLNMEFVNDVKMNKFGLTEGVICKSTQLYKKTGQPLYCKIKTNDWFDRLRQRNIEMYNKEIKESVNKIVQL